MKTLRLKLRDGQEWLNEAAKEVNMVWNFVNETTAKAARPFYGKPRYLSGIDVEKLLTGVHSDLTYLQANTVIRIAHEHADRRLQFKRSKLRWRCSGGSKRSLGWVPFRHPQVKLVKGAIRFCGKRFRVFDSYGLDKYELRSGSFSQNALGDWFINIAVKTATKATDVPKRAIGIDLGLKACATTSDGQVLASGDFYRGIERRIAEAQRRGHRRHAKRLHQRAANRRKDALHKFSTAMVNNYGAIYVGDVSSRKLVKTKMAKAVLDTGWGMLKTMLHYKGHEAGTLVEVVNERFTTVTCSNCGQHTGPRGLRQLHVRGWFCSACETDHDRDINAARNILARGLTGPSAGTKSKERQHVH